MAYCWKPWNVCKLSFELRSKFIPMAVALAGALLAGCSAVRPLDSEQAAWQPLYEQRAARLGPLETWALQGRLAMSDSGDGGSGNLSWRQRPDSSRMDFHGALGRGAWRLQAGEAGAEIEFADGRLYRADSIDALVRGQVGWQVPVAALAWWVRGLAAPGEVEKSVLDENGVLMLLQQDGWNIEYGRYGVVDGELMPLKLTARQEDRTVKLAIRKWELPETHERL
jgi:outer membrane lipoprotein LolB